MDDAERERREREGAEALQRATRDVLRVRLAHVGLLGAAVLLLLLAAYLRTR